MRSSASYLTRDMNPTSSTSRTAATWKETRDRVELAKDVGAMQGDAVRRLALLKTVGQHEYYRYLLRHVVVRAAKAGLLQPKDHKGVSLVSLARSVTDRLDCVRPDLPNTDDRILDSICQFDV